MPNNLKLTSILQSLQKEEAPEGGYWGTQGAGGIFLARNTGRFLFGLRSRDVREPGTWGGFGGKIEPGEGAVKAAEREMIEETGYEGKLNLRVLYLFKDGDFRYFNYLAVIDKEFEPKLNWENDNYAWVEYNKWPEPLHFGTEEALTLASTKIKQIYNANYLLEMDAPPPIVRQEPATNVGAVHVDVPDFSKITLPEQYIEKLADAIYRLEGGDKTKYPYGIKSIDTKGDVNRARRIAMNTIRNNYKRWITAGKPGKYLDFLADRFCPIQADKQGNINWKKNIRAISGMDF
jgi:8-oxo-dGTP pyrophosphatase MutT (NUDIX family)